MTLLCTARWRLANGRSGGEERDPVIERSADSSPRDGELWPGQPSGVVMDDHLPKA